MWMSFRCFFVETKVVRVGGPKFVVDNEYDNYGVFFGYQFCLVDGF